MTYTPLAAEGFNRDCFALRYLMLCNLANASESDVPKKQFNISSRKSGGFFRQQSGPHGAKSSLEVLKKATDRY